MAESYAFEVIIKGPDDSEQRIKLPIGSTTIGRQAGNEIVLNDQRISRHRQTNRHACHPSKAKFRKDLPSFKRPWMNDDRRTAGMAVP